MKCPDNCALHPHDMEDLVFNPTTGKMDVVVRFNPNRIVTAERNSAGHKIQLYDVQTDNYLDDAPQVVTDRFGNVVTT